MYGLVILLLKHSLSHWWCINQIFSSGAIRFYERFVCYTGTSFRFLFVLVLWYAQNRLRDHLWLVEVVHFCCRRLLLVTRIGFRGDGAVVDDDVISSTEFLSLLTALSSFWVYNFQI